MADHPPPCDFLVFFCPALGDSQRRGGKVGSLLCLLLSSLPEPPNPDQPHFQPPSPAFKHCSAQLTESCRFTLTPCPGMLLPAPQECQAGSALFQGWMQGLHLQTKPPEPSHTNPGKGSVQKLLKWHKGFADSSAGGFSLRWDKQWN